MSWLQRAWNTLSIAGPLLPRPGVYTVTLDCTESVVRAIEAMYGAGNKHLLLHILRNQTDQRQFMSDAFQDFSERQDRQDAALGRIASALTTEAGEIRDLIEQLRSGSLTSEQRAQVFERMDTLTTGLDSVASQISELVTPQQPTPEPGDEEEEGE
jgi:hypothetical protein